MVDPIEKNIESAAQKGPNAVTAYIRGDEASERAAQVNRAHEALDRLKAGNLGIDNENKKPILKAIIGQLDGMKLASLKDMTGTKPNVDALEKRLQEAKDKALAQERTMAVGSEVLTNEVREVVTDIKGMDTNALKSVGIFVGIPVLVGYLTKSLFGKGDGQNKPGIVRRFFSWMAGIGIGVAAFMGLRAGGRMVNGTLQAIDDVKNAPANLYNSAANGVNKKLPSWLQLPTTNGTGGGENKEKEDPNETPQTKLERLIAKGEYVNAFLHATANGGGLIMKDGHAYLHIENGKLVELVPEAAKTISEYLKEAKEAGSWMMIFFEGGAIYLVSRALANKILYGKAIWPKTLGDKILSVGKLAIGPVIPILDAAKYTSTYFFTPRGPEQLKASFVTQSIPARKIRQFQNWLRKRWFDRDIKTEKGLLETIRRLQETKVTIEVLKLGIGEMDDKGLLPKEGGDIDLAKQEMEKLTKRVEAGLTVLAGVQKSGGKVNDPRLAELLKYRYETNFSHHVQRIFDPHEVPDEKLGSREPVDARRSEEERLKTAEDERRASTRDEKAGEIEKRIQTLEEQFTRQSEELKQTKEQTDGKNTRIAELTQELRSTEQSLTAERGKMAAELETQTKAQAELKGQISSLEGQLQEAKNTSGANGEAAQKLQTTLTEKTSALDKLTREYEAAKTTLVSASEAHGRTVDALKASVSEKQGLIGELNKKLSSSEADTANLKERLAQAEQRAVALEAEAKIKATMEAREKTAPVRERPIAGGIDTAPVIEPGTKTKIDIKLGELKIGTPDEKTDPREKVREEGPRRIKVK